MTEKRRIFDSRTREQKIIPLAKIFVDSIKWVSVHIPYETFVNPFWIYTLSDNKYDKMAEKIDLVNELYSTGE